VQESNGAVQPMPSEVPHRRVLNGLPQAVLAIDEKGRIATANRAAGTLFGVPAARLRGAALIPLIEVDHRPEVQRAITRALAGHMGAPLECSIGVHTASHWVEVELMPADGGCLFVARDLRTRRALRMEVSRQHEALHEVLTGLLDNIPIGIVISDGLGAPRLVNRAARDLFGVHALAPLQRWCESGILLRADGSRVTADDLPAAHTLADGLPRRDVELRVMRPWGDAVPVLLNTDALCDRRGKVVEVCCTFMNIRERLHIERQLHHAQKMEAMGVLAGGIAHDFNNILCAIVGYAELGLREAAGNAALQHVLIEIKKAGGRATTLTKQVLSFSRVEPLAPRVLQLNHTVRDMDEMLRRLIGENIELLQDLSDHACSIQADPGHLEQIVLNLVVNAADAMPNGGRLRVRTRCVSFPDEAERHPVDLPAGRHAVLTVSDSGCGMEERTLQRIFEPFFTTKGRRKGTGLGLSTVYGIVKRNRGTIHVESECGRGTTFRVYLPCVEESARAPAARPVPAGPVAPGGETILLVEDEPMVRALIREILESANYDVLEARNGREALALTRQDPRPIHLLLTDVVMPKMGGPELARKLCDRQEDLRVLFVSGYADQSLSHTGSIDNRMAFLPKPFDAGTLTTRVRELLDHVRV